MRNRRKKREAEIGKERETEKEENEKRICDIWEDRMKKKGKNGQ